MHRISAVALALACGFGFFVDDATAIEPPALGEGAKVPIHLAFSEPTMTTEIYRAVGEAAGIEILFDTQLNAKRIPIDLEGTTAAVAFDRIATTAGQFWVPLDQHTILVADDTPAKRRQHETLYIRTFVLEYVDVKHVDRLLRSLVEVRRLSTHPEIKSIIIRETAAKMVTIKRLIEMRAAGYGPDVELSRWLETAPQRIVLSFPFYVVPIRPSQSLGVRTEVVRSP